MSICIYIYKLRARYRERFGCARILQRFAGDPHWILGIGATTYGFAPTHTGFEWMMIVFAMICYMFGQLQTGNKIATAA